jgi:hypothetical protein
VNTIHKRYDNKEKWTANCAIAIRAAADVFIIYGCGTPGRWIIKRLNCDNEHQYLDIYQRAKHYEVRMLKLYIISCNKLPDMSCDILLR